MSSDVIGVPILVRWNKWCDVPCEPQGVIDSLSLPVTKIIITVDPNFDSCDDLNVCFKRMREVQAFYSEEQSCPSTPFNFLISNDGYVFEGRGWQEKPLRSRMKEEYEDYTIDIAVIGKEKEDQHAALDVLRRFVIDGISLKLINEAYTVHSFLGGKMLF